MNYVGQESSLRALGVKTLKQFGDFLETSRSEVVRNQDINAYTKHGRYHDHIYTDSLVLIQRQRTFSRLLYSFSF